MWVATIGADFGAAHAVMWNSEKCLHKRRGSAHTMKEENVNSSGQGI